MRILHIIPSAFEYFEDIKKNAFGLIEKLNKLGIENEVITLQYNVPSQKELARGKAEAIARKYHGAVDFEKTLKEAVNFDVVHLHCPFLGAADKITAWKQANPRVPLLVTYYRDVVITDLISIYIRWYNGRHLPKVFNLADAVSCFTIESFLKSAGKKYLADKDKLVPLTVDEDGVKLWNNTKNVDNLINLYNYLIHS